MCHIQCIRMYIIQHEWQLRHICDSTNEYCLDFKCGVSWCTPRTAVNSLQQLHGIGITALISTSPCGQPCLQRHHRREPPVRHTTFGLSDAHSGREMRARAAISIKQRSMHQSLQAKHTPCDAAETKAKLAALIRLPTHMHSSVYQSDQHSRMLAGHSAVNARHTYCLQVQVTRHHNTLRWSTHHHTHMQTMKLPGDTRSKAQSIRVLQQTTFEPICRRPFFPPSPY